MFISIAIMIHYFIVAFWLMLAAFLVLTLK